MVLVKGLEPISLFFTIEVRYLLRQTSNGADDGNRTRVATLARLCSTIELHLRKLKAR